MTILTSKHLLYSQLRQLKHPEVRDLAWCCFSHPLMVGLPEMHLKILPELQPELWPWIMSLDENPAELLGFLKTIKSKRLGIYYETLWRFYFTHNLEWELLEYNRQLNLEGITLGAFDFLCRRGIDFFHIETAVKFYLCIASSDKNGNLWQNWIGINNNDRLDIKLNHLQHHQLTLGDQPAGKNYLQNRFPGVQWQQSLCLQGYLFYAYDQQQLSPQLSHPQHMHGYWLYADHFLNTTQYSNAFFYILFDRHQWLAPAQVTELALLKNKTQVAIEIELSVLHTRKALLIAVMQLIDNIWQESERFFVVPNNWPLANNLGH